MSPPPTPLLSLHHLEADHSHAYHQLAHFAKQLEQQFNEVQKVTFTIEDGVLFVLQAQPAPRSPKAAARIAVEMVREGSTSKSEAILKLNPNVINILAYVYYTVILFVIYVMPSLGYELLFTSHGGPR